MARGRYLCFLCKQLCWSAKSSERRSVASSSRLSLAFRISRARFFISLPFCPSPLSFPAMSHINCQFVSHFKVRCAKLLRKHFFRCVNGRFGERMKWNSEYESRYGRNEEKDDINTLIISCLLFIYTFLAARILFSHSLSFGCRNSDVRSAYSRSS